MSRKSYRRKKPNIIVGIELTKTKDMTSYRNVCDSCVRKSYCLDRSRGVQCNFYEGVKKCRT